MDWLYEKKGHNQSYPIVPHVASLFLSDPSSPQGGKDMNNQQESHRYNPNVVMSPHVAQHLEHTGRLKSRPQCSQYQSG
jgi:hypothetical protein